MIIYVTRKIERKIEEKLKEKLKNLKNTATKLNPFCQLINTRDHKSEIVMPIGFIGINAVKKKNEVNCRCCCKRFDIQ